MANPGCSDAEIEEAGRLFSEYGTIKEAADSIGMHRSTFTNRLNHWRAKQEGRSLKGTSTLYDGEGNVKVQWVKTSEDKERQEEIAREMAEAFAAKLPKVKSRTGPKDIAENLLKFIPLGDPHFGLYCWKKEVGNDFNLEIARNDLCDAIAYLVKQGPKAKRCVIGNLGDFFHADNLDSQTPANRHNLDTDTRLGKVIGVGVAAMRTGIDTALEYHEVVEVINAIGNHDPVLATAFSIMLAHIYENEPRVIVHDAPTPRHYIRHGKVVIGVTHGDKTKDRDLPGIMATEKAVDWGETQYRYWHRGHEHHDSVDEFNGCKVEQHRTLAPGDAWTVGKGYLSGRDMKAIIYDAEYGERARFTCSIDLLRNL